MSVQRKTVLWRVSPELLEQVDEARGALARNSWLTIAVENELSSEIPGLFTSTSPPAQTEGDAAEQGSFPGCPAAEEAGLGASPHYPSDQGAISPGDSNGGQSLGSDPGRHPSCQPEARLDGSDPAQCVNGGAHSPHGSIGPEGSTGTLPPLSQPSAPPMCADGEGDPLPPSHPFDSLPDSSPATRAPGSPGVAHGEESPGPGSSPESSSCPPHPEQGDIGNLLAGAADPTGSTPLQEPRGEGVGVGLVSPDTDLLPYDPQSW